MDGKKGVLNALFPPSSFAAIMGIEMCSISTEHFGLIYISNFLMYSGLILYFILGLGFILRGLIQKFKLIVNQFSTLLFLFTFTAGSDVLGTRLFSSRFSFLSSYLIILDSISLIALTIASYKFRKLRTEVSVSKMPLFFLPFISLLSLSIFIDTVSSFGYVISEAIFISAILLIAGEIGMWLVMIESAMNLKKVFGYIEKINAFSFIYFGILGLTSIGMIDFVIRHVNETSFPYYLIMFIVEVQLVLLLFISVFILSLYVIKIGRRKFELKYNGSMWASLFSSAVTSVAFQLFYTLHHVKISLYFSIFYGGIALTILCGICLLFIFGMFANVIGRRTSIREMK